jgi:hypothetical protein
MEYAKHINDDTPIDDNFTRHVGWEESNVCIKKYFSIETVNIISRKLTELLEGVDSRGRPIIIPNTTITSVMGEIFNSYRPPTGDIYGRYNVPTDEPQNYVQSMIDQVLEVIFSDVRNNLGMDECNANLNIWDATLMGDFNEKGLRQHPPIKVRKKNTNHRGMVSFMNY